MKIWFNGQLVEQQDAKLSIYDHGVLYGDGVFEGIRAYGVWIFPKVEWGLRDRGNILLEHN